MNGAAPVGGTTIAVKSSKIVVVTVPASVTVPQGGTSIAFPVTAQAVTATTVTTISATAGGKTASAKLTVTP